jgi:hypothetical protein
MRKTLLAFPIAAAAAFSTSASAQPPNYEANWPIYGPVAAGVVTGTIVGLGTAEAWWASTPALSTAAGGAAVGLVAGIGTMVAIHSVTTPCTGWRILVDPPEACRGGLGARAEYIERPQVQRKRRR